MNERMPKTRDARNSAYQITLTNLRLEGDPRNAVAEAAEERTCATTADAYEADNSDDAHGDYDADDDAQRQIQFKLEASCRLRRCFRFWRFLSYIGSREYLGVVLRLCWNRDGKRAYRE